MLIYIDTEYHTHVWVFGFFIYTPVNRVQVWYTKRVYFWSLPEISLVFLCIFWMTNQNPFFRFKKSKKKIHNSKIYERILKPYKEQHPTMHLKMIMCVDLALNHVIIHILGLFFIAYVEIFTESESIEKMSWSCYFHLGFGVCLLLAADEDQLLPNLNQTL